MVSKNFNKTTDRNGNELIGIAWVLQIRVRDGVQCFINRTIIKLLMLLCTLFRADDTHLHRARRKSNIRAVNAQRAKVFNLRYSAERANGRPRLRGAREKTQVFFSSVALYVTTPKLIQLRWPVIQIQCLENLLSFPFSPRRPSLFCPSRISYVYLPPTLLYMCI